MHMRDVRRRRLRLLSGSSFGRKRRKSRFMSTWMGGGGGGGQKRRQMALTGVAVEGAVCGRLRHEGDDGLANGLQRSRRGSRRSSGCQGRFPRSVDEEQGSRIRGEGGGDGRSGDREEASAAALHQKSAEEPNRKEGRRAEGGRGALP